MSATILYQPIEGTAISSNLSGNVRAILEEAFGCFPIELSQKDYDFLSGCRAANKEERAWQEIMDAIIKHGCIRVWAEY